MLALRSVLFAILIPGTVTVLIPYLIVSGEAGGFIHGPGTPLEFLGLVLMLAGGTVLLRCIWDFATKGHGTLAPIDPPRLLVVQGLFRYVRNPMYLGVLLILLGESAFFESTSLLLYTAAWFVIVNLVVVLYEEPLLRARFGDSYDRYFRSVHRWIPRSPVDRSPKGSG